MTNPTGPYGGPGPQNPYGQPQPGADPYGQNPYGQPQPAANPYGQPQPAANPYGQGQPAANPYGQGQPAANPYGQPQNPYGQPQPTANPYGQPQQAVQAPPQPGPNPYAQPQPGPNPYGQPQPGANPYGQPQPGPNPFAAPQNPYNQPAPGGPLGVNTQGATDDQSPLKRLGLTKIRLIGLVVLLVAAGGFKVYDFISSKSDPKKAAVGDCVAVDTNASNSFTAANDAKVVSCSDSSANFKVIGRFDDTSDTKKCETLPAIKDTDIALYHPSISTKNPAWVLCLEPTK